MSPSLSVFQLFFSLYLYNQDKIEKLIHKQSSKMKRSVAQMVILCLIVSCTIGEIKAVRSNSDGSEAWGYVEVRPSTIFISFQFQAVNNVYCWLYVTKWFFFPKSKSKNIEAHMFWWHYKSPYRVEDPSKPWPIILWLQGGPVSFLCICLCMCGCIYFYLTCCSYLIRLLYICFLSLEYFDHC